MATVISEEEAFAHLAEVVDRAMRGEEIDIERGGLVKLKLVPVATEQPRRGSFGFLKGKVSVPASSFEPLPEDELRAWEGRSNLLLDTHTLAWWAEGSDNLPEAVRDLIDDGANVVFVSAVSGYELALKHGRGQWPSAAALIEALDTLPERGLMPLPLTITHARVAGQLPSVHRDPFDRMLAAQALVDDLAIVSIDDKLDQFGVRRLW